MPDARDVLEEAIRLVQDRGWSKGRWSGSDGSMCISTAITHAACVRLGGEGWERAELNARRLVDGVLARRDWRCVRARFDEPTPVTHTTMDLVHWNDAHARDAGEVVDVLKDALAEAPV